MKPWSLSRRLAVSSGLLFSLLLLLLAAPVSWIAVRQQVAALDQRLADEGARFFHEWRERNTAPEMRSAGIADELRFFGSVRVRVGLRLVYAAPAEAAELPDCASGVSRFALMGRQWVRLRCYTEDGISVTLAASAVSIEAVIRDVLLAFLTALPVLGMAIYLSSRWLGRSTLAPLAEITATAERLNACNLTERIPQSSSPEEIGRLIRVLNALLDRLADGLDQARRFTADAAHELRTPLSVLQAGLDELVARPDISLEARHELDLLIEDQHRLAGICEKLLLLSRSDAGQLRLECRSLNLVEIAQAVLEDARILAEPHAIVVEAELPGDAPYEGDPDYLPQILLNLLVNAVKYNRRGGRVRLQLSAEPQAYVFVIGNTGRGIPASDATHLFRRFYSSTQGRARRGHGLGLSLSRELARAHGGDLAFSKSAEDWTEFQLTFSRTGPKR